MIKGITIILCNKIQTGTDGFGAPVYDWNEEAVENVLVAPSSVTEVLDVQNLTGKKAVYTLAIPKGDTHTWENQKVKFFGSEWRVINFPQKGIEELIPLSWNEKWMVEKYE